jgi:gas vesicle protein
LLYRDKEVVMKDGNAKFVAGFLVGAGLGVIGALLFAPTSGKRLRRDVVRESHRLANRVSETAEELRDKGSNVYEAATGAARDLRKAVHSVSG